MRTLSLREAAEEAPSTILTARQHAAWVADVEAYGATCIDCDREATPAEVDAFLKLIEGEFEGMPWRCGCTDLDDGEAAAPTAEPVRRSGKVVLFGDRADVVTLSGRYMVVRERLDGDWTVRVRAGVLAPERCDHGVVVDPFMRLLGLPSGRQWVPPSQLEAVCAALVAWASEDNSADAPQGVTA